MEKEYNLGCALSGGGAKGFAHLDGIQSLIDRGITSNIIAGTSVVTLVGAFIADGYTPEEIMHIFLS